MAKSRKQGRRREASASAIAPFSAVPGERELYLAGYDMACPRRLTAALKLVRAHATGGQKSVYEIHLTQGERRELRAAMRALMDPSEDRFFLLKLDRRAVVQTMGVAVPPSSGQFFFVS